MRKVKNIFFITEAEAMAIRKSDKDPFIDHLGPHFELEDGTIMYTKVGGPAAYERWVAPLIPG